MLKFSGFADLTSCLGKEGAIGRPIEIKRLLTAKQREDIEEMLTCLLARELPYALHASKAEALRCTDTRRTAFT